MVARGLGPHGPRRMCTDVRCIEEQDQSQTHRNQSGLIVRSSLDQLVSDQCLFTAEEVIYLLEVQSCHTQTV